MYQHHRDEKWRRNPRSILKDQQTLGREYSKAEKVLKPRKKVRFNKEIQVVTLNQMDAKGKSIRNSQQNQEAGSSRSNLPQEPSSAPSQNNIPLRPNPKAEKVPNFQAYFLATPYFQVVGDFY